MILLLLPWNLYVIWQLGFPTQINYRLAPKILVIFLILYLIDDARDIKTKKASPPKGEEGGGVGEKG